MEARYAINAEWQLFASLCQFPSVGILLKSCKSLRVCTPQYMVSALRYSNSHVRTDSALFANSVVAHFDVVSCTIVKKTDRQQATQQSRSRAFPACLSAATRPWRSDWAGRDLFRLAVGSPLPPQSAACLSRNGWTVLAEMHRAIIASVAPSNNRAHDVDNRDGDDLVLAIQ
jgi:hypothetical protein